MDKPVGQGSDRLVGRPDHVSACGTWNYQLIRRPWRPARRRGWTSRARCQVSPLTVPP